MATVARRPSGTFSSEYDELGLYTLVRVTAEFVSPEEPMLVTQAAWDAGRAPSGHPGAPSARAICARLADRDGKPFPWHELLELVFDDARTIERSHARRRGEADFDDLSHGHIYYALRRIARELEVSTLAPNQYAQARESLLGSVRQRQRGGQLRELLSTVGQIERVAGGWDRALELAELEPRPEPTGARPPTPGVPIVEALDRFAEATGGWFCGRELLKQFARDRDFALGTQTKGKAWHEYVEETTARREARGAVTHGMPPRGVHPTYTGVGTGAPRRVRNGPQVRPPGYWTLERCVEAVERQLRDLGAGVNPTQKRYLAWTAGRDDVPAPSLFAQYGGWRIVLAIARGAAPASTASTPKRGEDAERKREAIVLAHLDATGRVTTRDVQALLGIKPHWANMILRRLRERGIIVLGSKHATGRGVFYVRNAAN